MKNILSLSLFIALIGVLSCKSDTKSADAHSDEASSSSMAIVDGNYNITPANTKVLWTGYKPGGHHSGAIPVSQGSLIVKDGNISSGSFVLDFANLFVVDVKAEDGKGDLEAHLKGTAEGKENDFFNVTKYPSGKFEFTRATQIESNPDANFGISGNLTIKDQTQPVSFLAKVTKTENGFGAESKEFKIDRTKWGLKFMSKSFFDDLKDKFINDEISIRIQLSAEKA